MAMPTQKPGRSKQDYCTPTMFLDAVRTKLGISAFTCDLAAADDNAIVPFYFTEHDSAFDAPTWAFGGWNWCNPPYSHIGPWVERAGNEAVNNDAQTAVLVPASVGANWWRDYVHGIAKILCLNGRLKFVGCDDYYPKDCALLLFTPQVRYRLDHGAWPYDIWTWA